MDFKYLGLKHHCNVFQFLNVLHVLFIHSAASQANPIDGVNIAGVNLCTNDTSHQKVGLYFFSIYL